MVVHAHDEASARPVARSSQGRAGWLVLAEEGPAAHLVADPSHTAIHVVHDPRHFRDVLLAERPRVVICVQPPATTADLELVAAERRRRPGMRAVHLAPPESVAERLSALGLGFDDALTTDTHPAELAGRLHLLETLARARAGPASRLVRGDLELDLAAHELRRRGALVHLRPKEFGLLALLAAHPGHAYTRRQLLDRVWGPGHPGGSRTVDVHVRWLRAKIEPDPEHPVHLVTVRGMGYRLDEPER